MKTKYKMIHKLPHLLILFISLNAVMMCAYAQNDKDIKTPIKRSLSDTQLLNLVDNKSNQDSLPTTGKWVLIIINSNLSISKKMLKFLNNKALDLDKAVLLILNKANNKPVYQDYKQQLQVHNWIETTDAKILQQLHLSATPVVLGMQAQEVIWKLSGLPEEADKKFTLMRMNHWSKNKISKLIKNEN